MVILLTRISNNGRSKRQYKDEPCTFEALLRNTAQLAIERRVETGKPLTRWEADGLKDAVLRATEALYRISGYRPSQNS